MIVLLLLGFVSGGTTEVRIAVFEKLGKNQFLSLRALCEQLPEHDAVNIESIVDELNCSSRVPTWFHELVRDYIAQGGSRLDDPVLVSPVEARYPLENFRDQIVVTIRNWARYCVYPSMNFPGTQCHVDASNPDYWVLTSNARLSLIHGLSYEAHGIVVESASRSASVPLSPEAVLWAVTTYRKTPFMKPTIFAAQHSVPVELAKSIQNSLLSIFAQPAWLLDLLLSTQYGPITPSNGSLVAAIQAEEARRPEKVRGRLNRVIQAWAKLCIRPIRNGQVSPLPYTRLFRDGEFVAIRGSLVHKYLRNEL